MKYYTTSLNQDIKDDLKHFMLVAASTNRGCTVKEVVTKGMALYEVYMQTLKDIEDKI